MRGVRRVQSGDLGVEEIARLRELFRAAYEDDFTDEDWEHALGGVHFLLEEGEELIAHASVVPRELHVGRRPLATGYVEAVATRPARQRQGHGSSVMREVGAYIDRAFELGALAGDAGFYERLGWVLWRGPTFVRVDADLIRTAEEDGSVLVRRTPRSADLDVSAPISCDWRRGEVW